MRFAEYMFLEGLGGLTGVALYENPGLIGLYLPDPMRRYLVNQGTQDLQQGAILGVVGLRDNTLYRAMELDRIVAEHGYGPVLMIIAMQGYPDGLIATRTTQNTPAARKVWREFYDGKGSHLVEKEPLWAEEPDARRQATHYGEETYLDLRYRLKQPVYNLSQSRRLNAMVLRNDPYGEKKDWLEEALDTYLGKALRDIYGN